jgi:DNA-binding CsgD family transcriptional regulator
MWLVSAWPVAGSLPFELKPGDYRIGRSSEHAIVIYDSSISRIHARLRVTDRGEVTIEDLGSRNGVEVNGKLTLFASLRLNDRLRLGAVPCLITPESQLRSFSPEDESTRGGTLPKNGHSLGISDKLSSPQAEVLRFIIEGMTEDEVAIKTGRSYHTVHNHVRAIYRIYNVHSRGELMSRLKEGTTT